MLIRDSKVEVLDSLRAFAALSVCLFHFVCTVTGYIKVRWILDLFSPMQYGVQLFFVISGFVIPWAMYQAKYSINNFFSFFLKRLSRLEPPYVFSIVLALGILYAREHYLNKSNDHIAISTKQIFFHFGYLIPFFRDYKWLNQVYWTLAIEFQYYILIGLLYVPLIKFRFLGRLIIYILAIASSNIQNIAFLPYWLPVFLLGILLFMHMIGKINALEYYSITGLVILFCGFKYPILSVIYACIPLIAILNFKNVKIFGLHFIGKFSYSIYLIHPLIGASFINVFSHYTTHPLAKVGLIMLAIILTLLCSWITYIFIEKPSKNLSASIKYKNK